MTLAFFTADPTNNEILHPTEMARSLWSSEQMHGVAIAGAIARGLEQRVAAEGREDLQGARLTVDFFKPAAMVASRVRITVIREGRRLLLLDAEVIQDEDVVARASGLFLKPSQSADGLVWSADDVPTAPPVDLVPPSDEPRVPFFCSEAGWSQDFTVHQNAGRKQTWQNGLAAVEGEAQSMFVTAAAIADATSMVCNWGSAGVQYINTDITLALARPVVGREIGLAARDRFESAGIAVGTAVMFDRQGPVGVTMLTALSNALRTVDFEAVSYHDDGSPQVA